MKIVSILFVYNNKKGNKTEIYISVKTIKVYIHFDKNKYMF